MKLYRNLSYRNFIMAEAVKNSCMRDRKYSFLARLSNKNQKGDFL